MDGQLQRRGVKTFSFIVVGEYSFVLHKDSAPHAALSHRTHSSLSGLYVIGVHNVALSI